MLTLARRVALRLRRDEHGMSDVVAALARRVALRLRRDERGAIGVLVAVLLGAGVLTGMGALVVDVGQLYQERAELQNAADAAALGVAKSCVLGFCDPGVAVQYADANASRLTGGVAGVSLVCGSGAGLGLCPPSNGKLTDCPPPVGPNYVNVYTSTETGSGSTLLPPVFGRALLGTSYQGTTVLACAQATWGAPAAATTIALTISACEWDQATNQGTSFAPPPPYPPDPAPSPFLDQVLKLNSATGTGCASEPSGADEAGTFGWLADSGSDCKTAVSPPTMTGRNRTTVSSSCQQLLQSAQNNTTPLLVPIYVAASDRGAPTVYTLKGFAEFVVTGYNLDMGPFTAPFFASDWLNPANDCSGTTYCINGFFTHGVIPSTGSWNGVDLGAAEIDLTG
jgi:Putative Flp pilus-assembly TadE/G-like